MESNILSALSSPVTEGNEILEAGYVQRREWITYKIREDHYPFNTTMNFQLDSFDAVRLQKTINALVERHEILRTTLRVINGSLKQVIYPAEKFPIRFVLHDICTIEEKDKNGYIESKVNASIQMPFNFELGPMFRVMVFKKDKDQHILYFTFHHVIFDLHSFQVFQATISSLWKMFGNDFYQPLPAGNVQYKEYALHENEMLNCKKGEVHARYWEKRLSAGIPRLLVVEEERWNEHLKKYIKLTEEVNSRMTQLDFSDEQNIGGVLRKYRPNEAGYLLYRYDHELAAGILQYKEQGTQGLLSLFIAAFALTFYELSGQRFFAFDIPASSRSHLRYKDTIGWLTTGGPCFITIPEDYEIPALLDHIDEELYLLSYHCVYPFEAIGSRHSPPIGGNMPLFLTLITKDENITPLGPGVIAHGERGSVAYQDLALFFYLYNDAVSLSLGYDNFLFTPPLIEKIIETHDMVFKKLIRGSLAAGNGKKAVSCEP